MRVIILFVVFYVVLDLSAARRGNLKIKLAAKTDISGIQDSSYFKPSTSKFQNLKIKESRKDANQDIRPNNIRKSTVAGKESKRGSRHRNLEQRKKTNRNWLRLTMQHMFGFSQALPRNRNETGFANENHLNQELFRHQIIHTAPPDFMIERFHIYTEDSNFSLRESTTQGNTIRSFYPISDKTIDGRENSSKFMTIIPISKNRNLTALTDEELREGSDEGTKILVFAFNLSSIPAKESVVRTELRLNGLRNFAKQKRMQRNGIPRKWSANVAVYESSQSSSNETRNVYKRLGRLVTVRNSASYFETSGNILRLAAKARRNNRLLVVQFNYQRQLFGTDDFDIFTDQSPPEYFITTPESSFVYSSEMELLPLTPIVVIYCNDSTHSNPTLNEHMTRNRMLKNLQSVSTRPSLTRRRRLAKRKLSKGLLAPASDEVNNELPGENFVSEVQSSTIETTLNRNDRTYLHDNGRLDRQLIQSLSDRNTISKKRKKRKRRSRKCKKRKNKNSRKCNRKTTTDARFEADLNRAKHVCSRKSLRVDFAEIGWSDWIISPKHFDAYYCSGMCDFNTIKRASPSNHAIIQSFINEFNINPEIPNPCCVPESLTSLSVLYFDQNDSVVLKVYPHMSVDKCACR